MNHERRTVWILNSDKDAVCKSAMDLLANHDCKYYAMYEPDSFDNLGERLRITKPDLIIVRFAIAEPPERIESLLLALANHPEVRFAISLSDAMATHFMYLAPRLRHGRRVKSLKDLRGYVTYLGLIQELQPA